LPVRTRLRVGCCSGPYDAPITFALARGAYQTLNVNLNWVQCPPDACAVMSMLSAGLIDMAVLHTEDAVALAAEGNPLRFCGTFVSTPRAWGMYTTGRSSVQTGVELRGETIGMPDERGASLSISVFGDQPGWNSVLYCPRRPLASLQRAADAMNRGVTRATIWERRSARHLVGSGEWDAVGQVAMPWPSSLLVASKEALYAKVGAMRNFIHFAQMVCEDFKANKDDDPALFLSARHSFSPEEARDFIAETSWSCQSGVELQTVEGPLLHLKRAGMIDTNRLYDPAKFLAKEFCLVSQIGVLAPPPRKRPQTQREDVSRAPAQREDEEPGFEDISELPEPPTASSGDGEAAAPAPAPGREHSPAPAG